MPENEKFTQFWEWLARLDTVRSFGSIFVPYIAFQGTGMIAIVAGAPWWVSSLFVATMFVFALALGFWVISRLRKPTVTHLLPNVRDAMLALVVARPCPVCGAHDWAPAQHLLRIDAVSAETGDADRKASPTLFGMFCRGCACSVLYNIGVLRNVGR